MSHRNFQSWCRPCRNKITRNIKADKKMSLRLSKWYYNFNISFRPNKKHTPAQVFSFEFYKISEHLFLQWSFLQMTSATIFELSCWWFFKYFFSWLILSLLVIRGCSLKNFSRNKSWSLHESTFNRVVWQ